VTRNSPLTLIGFAEADAAPEVAWSLVDAGMQVQAFARRGRRSALRHSRYVTCHEITPPERDLESSLSELRELMTRLRTKFDGSATVLFPLDDSAVWLCDRAAADSLWTLAGPAGSQAELALDKARQVQLARECGMNLPATRVAQCAADVESFVREHGFPVVLKPSMCVSPNGAARPAWTCGNPDDLRRAIADWGAGATMLVQRFVAGTGEGVFGIADGTGVRAWSGHRRLRMMNPHGSGASACVAQDVPADLRSQVADFLEKAQWRGLFMIEMLRDNAGTGWFMELNGRPWGSMALARRQGLEYPAWQVSLLLDDGSTAGLVTHPRPGLVCRNIGRELMHLAFVWRGPRSANVKWPRFWRAVRDVLAIRSGDGIYNWRRSDWRVLVADIYTTVHRNVAKSRG
jgi:predicted ATP-grasp superfamily ATP-dependent carboligase